MASEPGYPGFGSHASRKQVDDRQHPENTGWRIAKARFQRSISGFTDADIIVQPELGTIYTKSTSKIAEHGGFSEDDTHVALLISTSDAQAQEIKSPVETMQVAPTILQALRLKPRDLQAVQLEKTTVLPGLSFNANDNSEQ